MKLSSVRERLKSRTQGSSSELQSTNVESGYVRFNDNAHPQNSKNATQFETEKSKDDDFDEKKSCILPPWFLDHCVLTTDELKDRKISLVLRDMQKDSSEPEASATSVDRPFVMDVLTYDTLCSALLQNSNEGESPHAEPIRFRQRRAALYLAGQRSSIGATNFFQAIVEQFSKDIGALLVTLKTDDIEDLAEYAATGGQSQITYTSLARRLIKASFANPNEQDQSSSDVAPLPLVIHIPEPLATRRVNSQSRKPGKFEPLGNNAISHIKKIISTHAELEREIILIETNDAKWHSDGNVKWVAVAPIKITDQISMLEKGRDKAIYSEEKNIRLFKRMLRQRANQRTIALGEPYADWSFLADNDLTLSTAGLLTEEDLRSIIENLGQSVTERDILQAVLQAKHQMDLLQSWADESDHNDKWSCFSEIARRAIHAIENEEDGKTYEWERRMLNYLVDPGSVRHLSWSDIELDIDTKQLLTQVLEQPALTGRGTYGILHKGRLGGAILYGAPGTGKTQLARILAREYQSTMIMVSAADLKSGVAGETERAIKGIFSLGRIVAPSIIFIDEAASLFYGHTPGHDPTSQLVMEMNELEKTGSPVFVLLATSSPDSMSRDVLRHVQIPLYMGVPLPEARERIFKIHLRDEIMGEDISWSKILEKTKGFSGSDIRSVCLLTAIICQASPTDVDAHGVRVLKQRHFDKALDRSVRTENRSALSQIRSYAQHYDPPTYAKIQMNYKGESGGFGSTARAAEKFY